MSKNESKLLAVVRIRSSIDRIEDVKHTLKLLNLTKPNHAVVVPNDGTHQGMLQKIKDVATWGEINKKILTLLIDKRGRIKGNKKIDNNFLKQNKFENMTSFITSLLEGKTDMRRIEGLKPVFRLHPPRKGYISVKRPVMLRGDLGYRGEAINELIEKMV